MRGLLFGLSGMALVVACGGSTSPTPGGDGGTTPPGTTPPGTTPGTTPPGTTPPGTPPGTPPPPGTPVCATDGDCNEDPAISSLLGTCFQGACFCRSGVYVQKSGKCGPTAPECATSGGTCAQNATSCPSGQIESSSAANMSCGDLVPAVCCFASAACKGPTFNCCGPTDAGHAPICENGWLTCPDGFSPTAGPCG